MIGGTAASKATCTLIDEIEHCIKQVRLGRLASAAATAEDALEPRSPSLGPASSSLCAFRIQFLLNLRDYHLESADDIIIMFGARFRKCYTELLCHFSTLLGRYGSLDVWEIGLVANDTHRNVVDTRVGEDLVPDDGHHLERRFRGHRVDDDVAVPVVRALRIQVVGV